MSNVLPKNVQKEVWGFYRNRFVLVGGIVASLLAGATFLSLVPAYMAVQTAQGSIGGNMESIALTDTEEEERAGVLRAGALLQELTPVSEIPTTFEALKEALLAKPSGTSIQKIQLTKTEKGHSIVLTGNTSDRTRVSAFKSALSEISRFESVTVPVGALAGSEDGQFSITITGDF